MTSTEGRTQPLVTVVWIRCYETSDLQLKNNQKLVPRISCDCDSAGAQLEQNVITRFWPCSLHEAFPDPLPRTQILVQKPVVPWQHCCGSRSEIQQHLLHRLTANTNISSTRRAFLSCGFIMTCVRPVTSPLRWQKEHSASLGTELVYPCCMLHLHNEKLKLLPSRICNCRPDGHLRAKHNLLNVAAVVMMQQQEACKSAEQG